MSCEHPPVPSCALWTTRVGFPPDEVGWGPGAPAGSEHLRCYLEISCSLGCSGWGAGCLGVSLCAGHLTCSGSPKPPKAQPGRHSSPYSTSGEVPGDILGTCQKQGGVILRVWAPRPPARREMEAPSRGVASCGPPPLGTARPREAGCPLLWKPLHRFALKLFPYRVWPPSASRRESLGREGEERREEGGGGEGSFLPAPLLVPAAWEKAAY